MRAWAPVVVCAVGIGVATTIYVPDLGLGRARFPVDKLVHFAMYFVLGWTVARALWVSGRRSSRAVVVALLAGLAFAALDEWHQTLLHWREASFADWLADAAGLSTGLALYLWPRRRARDVSSPFPHPSPAGRDADRVSSG